MKAHQRTEGLNDEWLTPRAIWSALGSFDTDPASPEFVRDPIAQTCFAKSDDGLAQKWTGRVWLNPPFNRYQRPKWMAKMAAHGNGIMLVPAATETEAFDTYVWQKADAVCFVKGRPHFHYVDGTRAKANCGCSIALVAYGKPNARTLSSAGLGKTIYL